MNKKILYAVAALVAVAVIALFFVLSDPGSESAYDEYRENIEGTFDDPSFHSPDFSEEGFSVTYADVLKDYERWAVYPPDSRPLRPEYEDQINHETIELPFRQMPVVNEDNELEEGEYSCRLQPLKHSVTEGQKLDIYLTCRQEGENPKTNVPVKIEKITLQKYVADRFTQLPQPEVIENFEAGEREGSNITKIVFEPRREDWGEIDLSVQFKIPAEESGFVHELKTSFFSSPVAPAKFTGNFKERIDAGSLIIEAEVQVFMAGRYTIEANLFSEDRPVAVARTDERLQTGTHYVQLKFFGKIFHDRGANGPYLLKGLRGIQDTAALDPALLDKSPEEVSKILEQTKTTQPMKRVIPVWDGPYETEPYKLEAFSQEEYDSPVKRERIAELKRLATGE